MREQHKQDFDTYGYRAQGRSTEKQEDNAIWTIGALIFFIVGFIIGAVWLWFNPVFPPF